MKVNPRKSSLLFSESVKYPGQVVVLWGGKLKAQKRRRQKKRIKHETLVVSLPGASFSLSLSLSFLTSSLISPCSRACTDITRRPAEMKQTEDKGNVKRKDVEIRSEEERWRKRTMGRERDGGFSVHLTVFSLDCFPSALELFLLCLSISLSFSYSLTLKH